MGRRPLAIGTDAVIRPSDSGKKINKSPPRNLPDAGVEIVAGVGPKRLAALRARGLTTFADALLHLPYRYEDLRRRDRIVDLREGVMAVIEGSLGDLKARPMRGMRWRRMTTAILTDAMGATIRVAWFNLYGDGRMPIGEPLILYGRVSVGAGGGLEMLHPEVYRIKAA